MGLPTGRNVRSRTGAPTIVGRALTAVVVLAVTTGIAPTPAVAAAAADPSVWAEQVCRTLVDFQSGALDARDRLRAVADASAPTDRVAWKATASDLRAALTPVRKDLARLGAWLGKAPPAGDGGETVRSALRDGFATVDDAYADAVASVRALGDGGPAKVPAKAGAILRALDRAIDRATPRITRIEPAMRRSKVRTPLAEVPVCRSIGPDWAFLLDDDEAATPDPPVGVDTLAGAGDLTAPSLLLPGRYRPTAEIAAFTAQTRMTGRSRTILYGTVPVVESGSPFVADCPAADSEQSQILGCFHDGRIYVLAVSRPEVAPIVPVTVAHEMLHAVYDVATDEERAEVDRLLDDFYSTTTDTRLRTIVEQYEARAPVNLPTELHSLVPTQVPVLTPALDAYYAKYFADRGPVVAAYDGYMSVFEGLIAQYDGLLVQVQDLRAQIAALRSQSDAAAGEAQRLAAQIDVLRAQGRLGEANALVPVQNDAARRAQSLNEQGNALIDRHNGQLDEANAIAAQIGGLQSSLRALG